MGWRTQTTIRHYTCRYCGDITERLSSYSKQADIAYCPNDGTELLIQVGGDHMGKKNGKPKLKVVHEVKTKHAQDVTAEPKTDKPDPELEKAVEALRKLGGKATSPELVKELGYTGESARDKVRRLMDRLHKEHKIHRSKEGKGYTFKLADSEPIAQTVEATA